MGTMASIFEGAVEELRCILFGICCWIAVSLGYKTPVEILQRFYIDLVAQAGVPELNGKNICLLSHLDLCLILMFSNLGLAV